MGHGDAGAGHVGAPVDHRADRGRGPWRRGRLCGRAGGHLAHLLRRPSVVSRRALRRGGLGWRGRGLSAPAPPALAADRPGHQFLRRARDQRRDVRAARHARRGRQLALHRHGQPGRRDRLVRAPGAGGAAQPGPGGGLLGQRRGDPARAGPGQRPRGVRGVAARRAADPLDRPQHALPPGGLGRSRVRRRRLAGPRSVRGPVPEHRTTRTRAPAARHRAEHAHRHQPRQRRAGRGGPVPARHRAAGTRARGSRRRGGPASPGRRQPGR